MMEGYEGGEWQRDENEWVGAARFVWVELDMFPAYVNLDMGILCWPWLSVFLYD